MKNFSKKVNKLFIIIIIIFIYMNQSSASNIGNSSNYTWSEKLGYISLGGDQSGQDYGMIVENTALTGYVWSEKFGWINLNDSGSMYTVTNDGSGNLSGHAWSEKLGYISFDDSSANNYYQVTISNNLGVGEFSGYAWSEKIGYIHFNDSGSLYSATSTWAPPEPPIVTTNVATNIATSTVTLNGNLVYDGNATTTVRGFKYALSATGTCDTWDTNETNGSGYSEGTFSLGITNLQSNTIYYYRAYATNSEGASYGTCTPLQIGSYNSPVILKKNVILKEGVILK